ncbi:MAG: amidohydrolase family protein [Gemmatimonadetes bacterium]|nr:amidohydrolase family protein [Gemmatimonadota bacterium]
MAQRRVAPFAALLGTVLGSGCQPSPPAPGSAPSGDQARYDVIISGGRLVDGAGNPWFYGDLAITGDRIARITPPGVLANAQAASRIDARGKVVAPGFIDLQAQSYYAFTVGDGRVISSTTQGITTAILGEGGTPAPANDATIAGYGPIDTASRRLMESFRGPRGFSAWLEAMEKHGIAQNVASFLGAATPRVYAKGEAQGAPTPAELDTMRAVVRNAMEDGALGIGSALIYPPASYMATEELVEMARVMAPYGGLYITHMRSEADRLLEGIDEALRVGKEGGVAVEIYHLKASGTKNWPKMARAIAKIDSARAAGQDVTADMYLYTAGGTSLGACAPPWAAEGGKLIANLQDPETRARIKAAMLRPDAADSEGLCLLSGPGAVQVVGFRRPELAQYQGQRLDAIARSMGKDWVEAWADLVVAENGLVGAIFHMMTEDNLPQQMRQGWIKWATDADGLNPDSLQGQLTHPRAFGNYPRLLGRYVREQRVVSLEEAIRKGTSAVAQRIGLADRGLLVQGHIADLIVFDPNTVIDNATFENPGLLSTGIEQVFVNGRAVVSAGKPTDAKPGRALRGAGWTGWSR